MTRFREHRLSTASDDSSSSSSPERGPGMDDDNDSFMLQANDSQSSLNPSDEEMDMDYSDDWEELCRKAPIYRLPPEVLILIFSKLSSSADLKSCMLVCREWARNSVALLWHRPQTHSWQNLQTVIRSIREITSYFAYYELVKRLNLSTLNHQISDGVLGAFRQCKRIERLTLTNCVNLTDMSLMQMVEGNKNLLALDVTGLGNLTDRTMNAVADNCHKLQGLNITECRRLTDESLISISENCRHLKRLKFNGCSQLTDRSIFAFAQNCRQILEVDLQDCRTLTDDAITAVVQSGPHLRELRLAHCQNVTAHAFTALRPGQVFESLRILDLTDCSLMGDAGIAAIVSAAPRLRNLVLAKCRELTDAAVMAITKLGKNLHYIHLGHCARITDAGVIQLVKQCNRIRYIDLACCRNLTDNSIQQLATLPKLRRIGLVKCENITDRSILALANRKPHGRNGPVSLSNLERVHLSYCTLLTLAGIHALLNNCPRLTHLSLTGVQAFLREDLIVFCREAPPEFNEHQRELFCVFSGQGVNRLRTYLNHETANQTPQPYAMEGMSMFDDADNMDESGVFDGDMDADGEDGVGGLGEGVGRLMSDDPAAAGPADYNMGSAGIAIPSAPPAHSFAYPSGVYSTSAPTSQSVGYLDPAYPEPFSRNARPYLGTLNTNFPAMNMPLFQPSMASSNQSVGGVHAGAPAVASNSFGGAQDASLIAPNSAGPIMGGHPGLAGRSGGVGLANMSSGFGPRSPIHGLGHDGRANNYFGNVSPTSQHSVGRSVVLGAGVGGVYVEDAEDADAEDSDMAQGME